MRVIVQGVNVHDLLLLSHDLTILKLIRAKVGRSDYERGPRLRNERRRRRRGRRAASKHPRRATPETNAYVFAQLHLAGTNILWRIIKLKL